MVGSNEFEESWLDEGLNDDCGGPRDDPRLRRPRHHPAAGRHRRRLDLATAAPYYTETPQPRPDPPRCAWCYASGQSYAVNSYMKVGLFMAQLKNDLGAAVFSRAQRAFFDEWSFRHPSTDDFFRTFERVSGRDLSTYRRNLVEGTATPRLAGRQRRSTARSPRGGRLRPARGAGHARGRRDRPPRETAQPKPETEPQDLFEPRALRQHGRLGPRRDGPDRVRRRHGPRARHSRVGQVGALRDPLQVAPGLGGGRPGAPERLGLEPPQRLEGPAVGRGRGPRPLQGARPRSTPASPPGSWGSGPSSPGRWHDPGVP